MKKGFKMSEEEKIIRREKRKLKPWKISEATKIKLSESKMGEKNPMYGKTTSQKQKETVRLIHTGKIETDETKKKKSESKMGEKNPMYGKKYTAKEKLVKSLLSRGPLGNNWQGGITKLNLQVRTSFEYRQWKSDIFTRDNFICQKCGLKGGRLHAHHKKSFNIILKENDIKIKDDAINCEELWNINNGETLCEKCHKEFHKIYGRENNTRKQLEEFLINN